MKYRPFISVDEKVLSELIASEVTGSPYAGQKWFQHILMIYIQHNNYSNFFVSHLSIMTKLIPWSMRKLIYTHIPRGKKNQTKFIPSFLGIKARELVSPLFQFKRCISF